MSEDYTGPARQLGPVRPGPKRRYTIEHRKGRDVVWTVTTESPGDAIERLVGALHSDGHSEEAVVKAVMVWAVVLMKGGASATWHTPDLKGATSISVKP